MSKAIGGYFDLDIDVGEQYYEGALGFNSARSAFAWWLRERRVERLLLPEFNCPVILGVAQALRIKVTLYGVDDRFRANQLGDLSKGSWLLYVNFLGLQDVYIMETLLPEFAGRLILDNAQALFSAPIPGVPSIYSPRKFIGVPDGGWLVDREIATEPPQRGRSSHRFSALLGRAEEGPEAHYADFLAAEESIAREGVEGMSQLTAALIAKTNLKSIASKRQSNFAALHQFLNDCNSLDLGSGSLGVGPLAYPLLLENEVLVSRLRDGLRARRIYVPTYWSGLPTVAAVRLSRRLLPLPIDQRYSLDDMAFVAREVRLILHGHRR